LRVHKAVVLAPTLKDLPPIKDNGFKLLVDTVPGAVYVVEANEDLSPTGWVVIHSFTSNGDAVDFVDQAAKTASRRFYRVRQAGQ
jgi:hypothetical protein